MHLGVLTTAWPQERDPTAGAFVYAMTEALAKRGHSATVVCARCEGDAPRALDGVSIERVDYAFSNLFYGRGAPDRLVSGDPAALLGAMHFPLALYARASAALSRCDALISHFVLPCGLVAGLLRRGRPHLAIAHGTDAHLFGRMPFALQRALFDRCTQMQLTHTSASARWSDAITHSKRLIVRPMGFRALSEESRAKRDETRARRGVGRDEVMALSVGRLVPLKGMAVLARAAREMPKGVRVVIAGEGPERAAIEREQSVTLVGAVDARERDALLAAADVFVLPSVRVGAREEGAPTVLLEAMGAGLPCVASDVGGVREVAGDAAMLISSGDSQVIVAAVRALVADAALRERLGESARLRVAAWSWDAQCASIEEALTVW